MNYFVLFSLILIAASVVVLLLPSSTEEGFDNKAPKNAPKAKPVPPSNHTQQPVAAGQRNTSSTAGSADGSSEHEHLLANTLAKHDRLAEAFENRDANAKTNANANANANAVSSTTTQKKGIASTSANADDDVSPPVAGCNKKCVKIGGTGAMFDPTLALGGNCINPPRAGGAPGELDYSIKFCPAFQPPSGPAGRDMRDQDCMTCGYYKFTSKCTTDPNNPKNPCDYEDYKYVEYQPGPMPGTEDKGDDDGGRTGPSCSTCQLNVNKNTQCVLPGCYSDGLPFPDDGGYNFAAGCVINDGSLPGLAGQPPGYYCPPITQGQSYDAGGASGDVCYTTQDPSNLNSYVLDYSKFVKIDNMCSNDKPKSNRNFKPGKDAPVDDNPNNKQRAKSDPSDKSKSSINHQHQHSGAINVYHHRGQSNRGQSNRGQSHQGNQGKQGNQRKQWNHKDKSNTYMEPEAGATVLGYL